MEFSLHGFAWRHVSDGHFHGMHLLATSKAPSAVLDSQRRAVPCREGSKPRLALAGVIQPPAPTSLSELRFVMLPWLEGWTRDLDDLDLPVAVRGHFSSAPCPSLLPSAFWVFTDGSACSHHVGCGVVLCVEHVTASESVWSFLGWSGHSCPVGSTNNDAESAAILQAATWALGVAWCLPVHIVADSWIATQSANGDSDVVNAQCQASVHQRARAVVQVYEAGKSEVPSQFRLGS